MPLGIGSPDAPKEPSLIEMRTDFLNAATGFANAKVQMDITELLALGDQDLPPRGQKRLLLDPFHRPHQRKSPPANELQAITKERPQVTNVN